MFFIKNFYAQYFQMQKPFLLFERIMILISTGYSTLTLIKLQKSKFIPTFVSKNFKKNQSEITQNTF